MSSKSPASWMQKVTLVKLAVHLNNPSEEGVTAKPNCSLRLCNYRPLWGREKDGPRVSRAGQNICTGSASLFRHGLRPENYFWCHLGSSSCHGEYYSSITGEGSKKLKRVVIIVLINCSYCYQNYVIYFIWNFKQKQSSKTTCAGIPIDQVWFKPQGDHKLFWWPSMAAGKKRLFTNGVVPRERG